MRGHYQVSASDGGDYSTPDQLAVPALAIINAYLGAVKGAALDHRKQVTLGYQANPVFYIDGVPGNGHRQVPVSQRRRAGRGP
jgi:hypothetical protein